MREDQRARLAELSEKLADVVLEEADPALWPGAGTPLADMSKDDRGDRYWCKKNAAATFALLERTLSTMDHQKALFISPEEADEDMAARVRARENEAAKVLAKAMKKAKGVTLNGRADG